MRSLIQFLLPYSDHSKQPKWSDVGTPTQSQTFNMNFPNSHMFKKIKKGKKW